MLFDPGSEFQERCIAPVDDPLYYKFRSNCREMHTYYWFFFFMLTLVLLALTYDRKHETFGPNATFFYASIGANIGMEQNLPIVVDVLHKLMETNQSSPVICSLTLSFLHLIRMTKFK